MVAVWGELVRQVKTRTRVQVKGVRECEKRKRGKMRRKGRKERRGKERGNEQKGGVQRTILSVCGADRLCVCVFSSDGIWPRVPQCS
jgi:hypothetical protein